MSSTKSTQMTHLNYFFIMKLKNKLEEVVLNEQLQDDELEQLKGGANDVITGDPIEDPPPTNGNTSCCNSW